jgi:CubicO group peptidase (beta-lactamase class C family)
MIKKKNMPFSLALLLLSMNAIAKNSENLNDFLFKSKLKTDGLIISKNGKTIIEKYAGGYDQESKHIMWSVSKSFTSAATGVAVKEGTLNLNQSVCDFYPEYSGTEKCKITVNHLLTYTAGLDWVERYEPKTTKDVLAMKDGDVFQMNNGVGRKDTASYVLSRKLKYEPGTTLQYNTGTPNVVMGILKKIYGDDYDNFIQNKLLNKLGANHYWLKDGSGANMGGSHLFTTPRVMHEFGKMYLNNGKINGEQVLDPSWVTYSKRQTLPKTILEHQDLPGIDIVESLGAMFWLNTPVKGAIPWPDAPLDTYVAWGHWSQFIIIIPSEKVVIVRTGTDKSEHFDLNKFIKLSLEFIKEGRYE